jgi:hypothetical protein
MIGKHIMHMLGESLFCYDKEKVRNGFFIQPSLDDRMFVLGWYGNNELTEELCSFNSYLCSDKWYRYVFVDNDYPTVQNERMKERLLKEATYDRWSKYGTLFGITRYSFVLLTSKGDFATDVLRKHMHTMYFQMATMLLANRTSILRFGDEIAALVMHQDDKDHKTHTEKTRKVYDVYLKYYSRIYFKEITHQDQGIELYSLGLKQMKIAEHHEKLDNKFTKLFEYNNMMADGEQADAMNRLTILGTIFLPVSVFLGILGLDVFSLDETPLNGDLWLGGMIAFIMFISVIYILLQKEIRPLLKQDMRKTILFLVTMALVVAAAYIKFGLSDNPQSQNTKKTHPVNHTSPVSEKNESLYAVIPKTTTVGTVSQTSAKTMTIQKETPSRSQRADNTDTAAITKQAKQMPPIVKIQPEGETNATASK